MADKDAGTPRVFLIRHGATEWSRNGRYTGVTDLPLLPEGEDKVRQTASAVFGPGLLIDPARLAKIYVSPRQRAQRTLELLFEAAANEEALPSTEQGSGTVDVTVTNDVAEWNYGDYEGMFPKDIVERRKQNGLEVGGHSWDVFKTGAEDAGGESKQQVQDRIDRLINSIVKLHREYLADAKAGKVEAGRKRDVLIVAHGHISRAFMRRWLGFDISTPIELMLEPGGVCGLSYAHGRVEERALLAGMSFPKRVS